MMKTGRKPNETHPKKVSEALAVECAELMHKKANLEKQREAVFQDGFSFVESTLSGAPANESGFRECKTLLETLNAEIVALSGRIGELKKNGHEAVREEAEALMSESLETKARLIGERQGAIR